MKKHFPILLVLVLLFSLTNCTITKRQFRKGYHVSWHKNNKSKAEKSVNEEFTKTDIAEKEGPTSTKEMPAENNEPISISPVVPPIEIEEQLIEKFETVETGSDKLDEGYNQQNEIVSQPPTKTDEPEEEVEEEKRNPIWTFLGVIFYIFLSPIVFILGTLAYVLISNAYVEGWDYQALERIGIFAAFLVFWLGGFGLMAWLFPKKEASREEKNLRLVVKALITFLLAFVALFVLILLVL